MPELDPWREAFADNLDQTSFTRPTKKDETPVTKEDWADFYDTRFGSGESFESGFDRMIKNPTADFLEAAAAHDPQLRDRLDNEAVGEIAEAFLQSNPEYYPIDSNYERIVKRLISKHGIQDARDTAKAELALYRGGHWTVEAITAAYKYLLKQGLLEVEAGKVRELSKEEKIAVISAIRCGDLDAAVYDYVAYSYDGNLPRYSSQREFLTSNPQLASRAALFVWANSRTDVTPRDYSIFLKRISRVPLLTISTLDTMWEQFCREPRTTTATPVHVESPEEEAIDYDKLSDEELSTLRMAALREHARRR